VSDKATFVFQHNDKRNADSNQEATEESTEQWNELTDYLGKLNKYLRGAKLLLSNGKEIDLFLEGGNLVFQLLSNSPRHLFEKEFILGDLLKFLLALYTYIKSTEERSEDRLTLEHFGQQIAIILLRIISDSAVIGGGGWGKATLLYATSLVPKLVQTFTAANSTTGSNNNNLKDKQPKFAGEDRGGDVEQQTDLLDLVLANLKSATDVYILLKDKRGLIRHVGKLRQYFLFRATIALGGVAAAYVITQKIKSAL